MSHAMDPSARRALARLRDPSSRALADLARMTVEQATLTPIATLAKPRFVASQLAAVLEAGSRGDLLRSWVDRRIASERGRWGAEESPLRGFLPKEAHQPLRELLGRPYAPDEELVFRIIDQPAIRNLVRLVLTDTVTRFRRRLSEWDSGMFGGLGRRAAARGKGLFGNVGRNLGGMAENLVEAVKEEVDSAFEGRIKDFVAGATTEAMRTIARYAADPTHAASFGELRLAILDVVLDTPIRELANETDKMKPETAVDVLVVAVRSMVAQPDFVARAEARIESILAETGDGTLGAWLAEVGLAEVWTNTTTELIADRLRAVVETDGFEGWWAALFEGD
ncbi:MAG: hypothetical protein ABMA64_34595 [Myxococcota bacterium]